MEVLHDMLDQVERQRLNKMMDEMPDNVTIQQRYIIPTERMRCLRLSVLLWTASK